MATLKTILRVLLLVLLTVPISVGQAQKSVKAIEIRTGWGGLGAPQKNVVTIQRKGDEFISNGRSVSADKVQALVSALLAAPVTKPELTNLGITTEWLKTNVASQKPRAWAQATATTAKQQQMFNNAFTDVAVIEKALPSLFTYTKFDDYPGASVDVVFEDGSTLGAESHSYYVFMLPWKVSDPKTDTYNAAISRAVSALLPGNSVNKERLAGNGLAEQLTESVMRSIEREWNLLGSDERAGQALEKLRTTYEVVTAELTPYHHPEYGTATYKGEPEEMNLHASVRKDTFPPNVDYALVLRYANGKVEGVDEFLHSAQKYEKLALSVAWLNKYIHDNPRVEFRISYVHNQSFGDKAMRVFTADMKLRGREDLIEQVKPQQADVVLLIVGNTYSESYWLLFPDKHMMLWRYGGPSGLLKWTRNDFDKGQCSEYENNYGGCSGREVTADGTLAAAHAPQDQDCMAKNQPAQSEPMPRGNDLFPVMNRGREASSTDQGKS